MFWVIPLGFLIFLIKLPIHSVSYKLPIGQTFLPGSPFCPGGPLGPRPLMLLSESIVVRLIGVVEGFKGAEITIVNLYIEF